MPALMPRISNPLQVRNNIANVATFSSYGPTSDGRIKPDIIAPGVDILSANATTGGAPGLRRGGRAPGSRHQNEAL